MPSDKFRIVCKQDEECEIALYDVIDSWYGISATAIRDALKSAGKVKTIRLRINSLGGSVFDGTAIYNLLKSHSAKKIVTIDGTAASMASVVAMAGDEIEMGEGAWMMIHDPLAYVGGDASEMRDMADFLERMKTQLVGIYARRTGRSEEDVAKMMSEETWLTAAEAVKEKFADRTVPGLAVAASIDPARFSRIPQALLNKGDFRMSDATTKTTQQGPATFDDLKQAFPKASSDFICEQMGAKATMPQAQAAYQSMLETRNAELAAKAAAAEAKATEAEAKGKTGAAGVAVVPEGGKKEGGDNSGDPIAAWDSALSALEAKGFKHGKAISKLAKEQPEMHSAYIAAYNEIHKDARR